ncbi:helix-turn-helix transcriptional regulator [Roseospira goensis]|uniref:DNA-binding CsgD family transcriptional regulator n=1 Tax=Roseospira goensis TaxID=391922 RepID=A0A7W6RXA0_9PROT|nr:helix-turn-helix transcriptional regulator [Roseospira goensis]MBB4284933.1 DNA-binding CsgD family transcriptional regulator [Roseospira goensis]
MLQAQKEPPALVCVPLAGDPAPVLNALRDAGLRHRILEHREHLARMGAVPVLVLLDETDAEAIAALRGRTADTTVVVRGLTAAGEEALVRAGADEVLDLADVTPARLTRALHRARLRRTLSDDAERARTVAYDMLDRLPLALVLVRPDGRVVHANTHAKRLLETGTALGRNRGGYLVAAHADETSRLRSTIEAVAEGGALPDGTMPEGAIAVRPRDGGTPYAVIVVPAGPANPGAALFIADPEATFTISDARLSALYGLTRSEAQIVARLARGQTLDQIAADRGQQLATLRSQLKSVFRKTSTQRQADVIKMVLSGPAVIAASAADSEASPDPA